MLFREDKISIYENIWLRVTVVGVELYYTNSG